MNAAERLRAVFKGQPVDRVPVIAWLGVRWLEQLTGKSGRTLLRELVDDPLTMVKIQEDLGLDPIVVTIDERWFSQHNFWRLLYGWPEEALETWQVRRDVTEEGDGFTAYRFTATTPEGPVTWGYQVARDQLKELERPIKDDRDIDLLVKYMPEPESLNQDKLAAMVQAVGDRGFCVQNFLGVWGEAANVRGLTTLCMDLYDRPEFVKRLSQALMERAIRRVRHLAKTGMHSILYDQTWVGVGFSPKVYQEFMLPYDKPVVKAAQEAGLLVSYHNCGKGMRFLEDMVSTGAEALETLTPPSASGDFDLAEVKRRVGDRITLNGGFNDRLFATATSSEVQDEVKRCIDAAAAGGRYILRPIGQVTDVAPGNFEAFVQAGRAYGQY
jgi:uroporphyrinogen-III decarboxylase